MASRRVAQYGRRDCTLPSGTCSLCMCASSSILMTALDCTRLHHLGLSPAQPARAPAAETQASSEHLASTRLEPRRDASPDAASAGDGRSGGSGRYGRCRRQPRRPRPQRILADARTACPDADADSDSDVPPYRPLPRLRKPTRVAPPVRAPATGCCSCRLTSKSRLNAGEDDALNSPCHCFSLERPRIAACLPKFGPSSCHSPAFPASGCFFLCRPSTECPSLWVHMCPMSALSRCPTHNDIHTHPGPSSSSGRMHMQLRGSHISLASSALPPLRPWSSAGPIAMSAQARRTLDSI